ncbi:MAG: nickel pincer cofactor biosynthesis protein LarB [Pseudomonadota bacterium]
MQEVEFDWDRQQRTGVSEAVLCEGKTAQQISDILSQANERQVSLLLTRLTPDQMPQYQQAFSNFEPDARSHTAVLNNGIGVPKPCDCLIVTAGSSDLKVALEAQQTLRINGLDVKVIADCGVAGLWRLTDKLDQLNSAPVIIAVAGMEGALFPVLAGLVKGVVIAVPTSNGYGVATGGRVALGSALSACSPGVVTVNIDNGFGAACALLKMRRPLST